MTNIITDTYDTVHTVHKSVFILLLKGAMAWVIAIILWTGLPIMVTTITGWTQATPPAFTYSQTTKNTGNSAITILHTAIALLLGGGLLFITLDWMHEYYIIEPNNVIVKKGIVFIKETNYAIRAIQSIGIHQGLWGHLFKFGTMRLFNPALKEKILLKNIANPYEEAHFILRMHPTPNIIQFLSQGSIYG